MDDSLSVSPVLLAAQKELNRRVAELAKASSKATPVTPTPSPSPNFGEGNCSPPRGGDVEPKVRQRGYLAGMTEDGERQLALPAHLGWHSARVTDVLRSADPHPSPPPIGRTKGSGGNMTNDHREGMSDEERPLPESIKVFGHVLDAIHRRGEDSLGRVWLLLRVLDSNGEGRVPVRVARAQVTGRKKGDNGRLRCYSWRRLRQLLQEGEGRFWHRDKQNEHIYYHSEARVARELDIDRIRGWAVEILVADLLGSVSEIRALFHDCFHSARGDGFNEPITRRVMETRGGGDPRTQRKYEQIRGVESRANYANMGEYSKEALAWHKGLDGEEDFEDKTLGPAFTFVDFHGTLGKSHNREQRPKHQQHWHKIYILRQMANAYEGTLRTVKRGRKWTNRKLTHLCNTKELRGSCEETVRLYYGSVADTTFGRNGLASANPSRSAIQGERPLCDQFVAQTEMVWVVASEIFGISELEGERPLMRA